MFRLLSVFLIIQLSLIMTFAQITFTREWTGGKRSAPTSPAVRRGNCVSFMPTINFLMQIEKFQQKECVGNLKLSSLNPSWKAAGDGRKGARLKEQPYFESTSFNPKD